MKKRYRIKSKSRFCITVTILLIIIISAVGSISGKDQALSLSKPVYTEITIVTGDTLWDLAKTYGPADQDIRKVVHAICKINNTSADKIQPGQKSRSHNIFNKVKFMDCRKFSIQTLSRTGSLDSLIRILTPKCVFSISQPQLKVF